MFFQRQVDTIPIDSYKPVSHIDVRLLMADAVGQLNITDIMLQGGGVATIWTGHPSEIKWSFDG